MKRRAVQTAITPKPQVIKRQRRAQPQQQPSPTISKVTNITPQQATYLRLLSNNILSSPHSPIAQSAAAIAHSLVGVQAQEPTAGFLSIYRRMRSPVPETSNHPPMTLQTLRNLIAVQHLVRIWAQRGTLHIFSPQDWPLVTRLFSDKIIKSRITAVTRGQFAGPKSLTLFTTARSEIETLLQSNAPITRSKLEELGHDLALSYSIFMCVTLTGHGSRMDVSDGGSVIIHPRNLTLPWTLPTEFNALTNIAERYFDAYGPATEQDFRYHFSLLASATTPVISHLLSQNKIVEVVITSLPPVKSYISVAKHALIESLPEVPDIPTLLLPRFDPLLLAHKDKSIWVDAGRKGEVWTKNGIIKGTVLVKGRIEGVWKVDGNAILVDMFEEVGDERGVIVEEGERVLKFLERTGGMVHFI